MVRRSVQRFKRLFSRVAPDAFLSINSESYEDRVLRFELLQQGIIQSDDTYTETMETGNVSRVSNLRRSN